MRLGFSDPASDKYVGSPETWRRAEAALEAVCRDMDLPNLSVERGEAAFYGPKADFVVSDCIGRDWQLGTVQLDYNLPSAQRFGLQYIGADNQPHQPVMIHRAPFGSFERFVGMLIEHFAGAFPLWLAPEQARVLVVSEKVEEYGRQVERRLKEAGLRVSGDYRAEKIGSKIRDAQLELVPYMFVLGGREAETGQVALRDRLDGDLGAMPVEAAIARLQDEIQAKTIRQVVRGARAGRMRRRKDWKCAACVGNVPSRRESACCRVRFDVRHYRFGRIYRAGQLTWRTGLPILENTSRVGRGRRAKPGREPHLEQFNRVLVGLASLDPPYIRRNPLEDFGYRTP